MCIRCFHNKKQVKVYNCCRSFQYDYYSRLISIYLNHSLPFALPPFILAFIALSVVPFPRVKTTSEHPCLHQLRSQLTDLLFASQVILNPIHLRNTSHSPQTLHLKTGVVGDVKNTPSVFPVFCRRQIKGMERGDREYFSLL